ncbi:uncharacterized protein LOC118769846 isoform X2 [Megalops cyprinoides]|uniref:uncharacterized protein LOC118769846 isoform X2 n=1 Tax=Megalops cyprinoides TaxID=118141 RepID=UPI001863E821|nr:uncharacterized protein LOC118769846 isoform X2 [Megalops cyprinoides]
MSESVYTYVNDTLDKLSADEFNRFKRKLSELKKIGYGLIEKAATVDLTWEIVNRFTEEGAVECVVDVLNAIDLKKFAKELEKEAHTCVEFVDDNKAELIQRIKLVEPLAEALGAMIPDEAYSKIRAARTSQEKMRELYSALEEGGPVVKAAFYRALCKQNKYLVEHLGGH